MESVDQLLSAVGERPDGSFRALVQAWAVGRFVNGVGLDGSQ